MNLVNLQSDCKSKSTPYSSTLYCNKQYSVLWIMFSHSVNHVFCIKFPAKCNSSGMVL